MKKLYFLLFTLLITSTSFGQVEINEFQPNANGADPDPASFEIKGTPSATFSGVVLFIESDPGGSNPGDINSFESVSGTFDSNGLLVVSIADPENPSFTVALVDTFTGDVDTDLDADDDGTADDLSTIGTVYDAIGIPDTSGDEVTLYGAQLGGMDFSYSGDEPQLVFRDGATGDWYAINDPDNGEAYDINGNEVIALGSFDIPANVPTFGSTNPVYTLATGPIILVGTVSSVLDYEFDNGPSAAGDFTVEGSNLTDDILVTAPTDFEISETEGGTYTPSITLSEGGTGAIASTTIYVRLISDLAINSYSGDVTVTSAGADSKTVALSGNVYGALTNALAIKGVFDAAVGSSPKGMEIEVLSNIPDLSIFGVGSANNGGGSDGEEFTFPAVSATAGDVIYVVNTNQIADFNAYFGLSITEYASGAMSINGDDAIELFESGQVIDVFGTIDCDPNSSGSACPEWEHTDGWAYRNTAGPSTTFVHTEWDYSGVGNLDGATNGVSTDPYPGATLGLDELETNSFNIYPNPTITGFVNISSSSNDLLEASVFDILGKQVLESTVTNNQLNVSSLNAGVYILKLTQNNASTTKKLVIQ